MEIHKASRDPLPRIPFERAARDILGSRYSLSLVVCGDSLARKMNRAYRKMGYAANVLSFSLDRGEGEIFLNVQAARREARDYGVSVRARLMLLFVHACCHLKGLRHGKRMESLERKTLKRFES